MRETIEAAIIVSVLLGLVESLVDKTEDANPDSQLEGTEGDGAETTQQRKKRLIKRMRWQSEQTTPSPSALLPVAPGHHTDETRFFFAASSLGGSTGRTVRRALHWSW